MGQTQNDGRGRGRPALGADHVELDVDIVTRGVRVGADLFVRLLDQVRELRLLQALVLDTHLHGKTEAAAVARADRDGAGDLSVGRVLFVLLGNKVNRAAETSGIACSEKMLWRRRGSRLARAAHLLRHRQSETMPSLDLVRPLRPPTAVAVAVYRGLIVSMGFLSCGSRLD